MKSISYWAKLHPVKARFSLVTIKLLLAFLAVYTGVLLAQINIIYNSSILYITALAALFLVLAYPQKSHKHKFIPHFYAKQKICDFAMAICSFISIMVMVNNLPSRPVLQFPEAMASAVLKHPTASQILESLKYRDKGSLTKLEKRILKKELVKEIKIYAISTVKDESKKRNKAGLIILTILGSLGLTILVAALACSLTCNGSDVAAILVGVLGFAGLVWASAALINRIIGGAKKPKEQASPE